MEIARKKDGGQTVVLGLETSCDETAAAVVARAAGQKVTATRRTLNAPGRRTR